MKPTTPLHRNPPAPEHISNTSGAKEFHGTAALWSAAPNPP
jgi:hypothetical protein